ncbi:MAG: peptide chain release factor 3, partial [Pirellulales bacterium]
KQRGISVSSTVLSFEFDGFHVNLLDTPGHQDFSEDTYRTLMAADCAVMVIDLAKGIEQQTEKLFRVCALRGIPVITFVNKVDRAGQEPLAILAEIESKLGIEAIPLNWPIGMGRDFVGVVDLPSRMAQLFDDRRGDRRVAFRSQSLDALSDDDVTDTVRQRTRDEVHLLEAAGAPFDSHRFLEGAITPVFFGSALTNFGVEHFLQGFLRLCPPPTDRPSDRGLISATCSEFSGFVFKIQANLDPRHRDRVAFVRVCSGRFQREMEVLHPRSGKKLRLNRAHRVFGQDRETVEEAFPGDIVGLVNPGEFRLGDTLCQRQPFHFDALPQFSPEHFAVIRCRDTARRKQFERGLQQLIEEGAVQMFHEPHARRREPILGAVGELQFDVVRFRLESEYNTETLIERLPFELARWIDLPPDELRALQLPYGSAIVEDQHAHAAILFKSRWEAEYYQRQNPNLNLATMRTDSGSHERQRS